MYLHRNTRASLAYAYGWNKCFICCCCCCHFYFQFSLSGWYCVRVRVCAHGVFSCDPRASPWTTVGPFFYCAHEYRAGSHVRRIPEMLSSCVVHTAGRPVGRSVGPWRGRVFVSRGTAAAENRDGGTVASQRGVRRRSRVRAQRPARRNPTNRVYCIQRDSLSMLTSRDRFIHIYDRDFYKKGFHVMLLVFSFKSVYFILNIYKSSNFNIMLHSFTSILSANSSMIKSYNFLVYSCLTDN